MATSSQDIINKLPHTLKDMVQEHVRVTGADYSTSLSIALTVFGGVLGRDKIRFFVSKVSEENSKYLGRDNYFDHDPLLHTCVVLDSPGNDTRNACLSYFLKPLGDSSIIDWDFDGRGTTSLKEAISAYLQDAKKAVEKGEKPSGKIVVSRWNKFPFGRRQGDARLVKHIIEEHISLEEEMFPWVTSKGRYIKSNHEKSKFIRNNNLRPAFAFLTEFSLLDSNWLLYSQSNQASVERAYLLHSFNWCYFEYKERFQCVEDFSEEVLDEWKQFLQKAQDYEGSKFCGDEGYCKAFDEWQGFFCDRARRLRLERDEERATYWIIQRIKIHVFALLLHLAKQFDDPNGFSSPDAYVVTKESFELATLICEDFYRNRNLCFEKMTEAARKTKEERYEYL